MGSEPSRMRRKESAMKVKLLERSVSLRARRRRTPRWTSRAEARARRVVRPEGDGGVEPWRRAVERAED